MPMKALMANSQKELFFHAKVTMKQSFIPNPVTAITHQTTEVLMPNLECMAIHQLKPFFNMKAVWCKQQFQDQGHHQNFPTIAAEYLVPSQALVAKIQPSTFTHEGNPTIQLSIPARVPNQPATNCGEIAARQGRHGDLLNASTYSCEGTTQRGTQGQSIKNVCLLQLYQNNMAAGTPRETQYISTATNRQNPNDNSNNNV